MNLKLIIIFYYDLLISENFSMSEGHTQLHFINQNTSETIVKEIFNSKKSNILR